MGHKDNIDAEFEALMKGMGLQPKKEFDGKGKKILRQRTEQVSEQVQKKILHLDDTVSQKQRRKPQRKEQAQSKNTARATSSHATTTESIANIPIGPSGVRARRSAQARRREVGRSQSTP